MEKTTLPRWRRPGGGDAVVAVAVDPIAFPPIPPSSTIAPISASAVPARRSSCDVPRMPCNTPSRRCATEPADAAVVGRRWTSTSTWWDDANDAGDGCGDGEDVVGGGDDDGTDDGDGIPPPDRAAAAAVVGPPPRRTTTTTRRPPRRPRFGRWTIPDGVDVAASRRPPRPRSDDGNDDTDCTPPRDDGRGGILVVFIITFRFFSHFERGLNGRGGQDEEGEIVRPGAELIMM